MKLSEFAVKKPPFSVLDVKMEEFLPDEILRFSDREGHVLMLHTSSIGVADEAVCDYISKILYDYPNIKVVLAHIGRYYEKSQFIKFYNSGFLESHSNKNMYFDMSSVSEKELLQLVLEKDFLHDRIMFGSDLPYGLIKLSKEHEKERCNLTYNVYHSIKALKDAIDALNLPQNRKSQMIRKVFYENAKKLFT